MLKELLKVANKLDALGLSKEADTVDSLIQKIAGYTDFGGGFDEGSSGGMEPTGEESVGMIEPADEAAAAERKGVLDLLKFYRTVAKEVDKKPQDRLHFRENTAEGIIMTLIDSIETGRHLT